MNKELQYRIKIDGENVSAPAFAQAHSQLDKLDAHVQSLGGGGGTGGGGGRGGLLGGLNDLFGRGSESGKLAKLFAGGGAIFALTKLSGEFDALTSSTIEWVKALESGKQTLAGIGQKISESLPFAKGFVSAHDLWQRGLFGIKLPVSEAEQKVAGERLEAAAKARGGIYDIGRGMAGRGELVGLTGAARLRREAELQAEEARRKVNDLAYAGVVSAPGQKASINRAATFARSAIDAWLEGAYKAIERDLAKHDADAERRAMEGADRAADRLAADWIKGGIDPLKQSKLLKDLARDEMTATERRFNAATRLASAEAEYGGDSHKARLYQLMGRYYPDIAKARTPGEKTQLQRLMALEYAGGLPTLQGGVHAPSMTGSYSGRAEDFAYRYKGNPEKLLASALKEAEKQNGTLVEIRNELQKKGAAGIPLGLWGEH